MSELKTKPDIRFAGFAGDWDHLRLGDVSNISSGFMGDSLLSGGKYRLTRIETISDSIVDEQKVGFTNEQPDESYRLNLGDILYSNINSIPHIGKVAIYQGCQPLYHGINLLRLSTNKFNNYCFVFYQLTTEIKRDWARSHANQAVSQASINQALLLQQCFWACKLDEQAQIGTFFTNLDRLITLQQREYDKTVNIKKAMLEKMFPKAGADRPEIRFAGFTSAWEQRKLGDLVELFSGLTYSPNDVADDGVLVLRSSNVKNGEIINADNVYVRQNAATSDRVIVGDIIIVVRNGSRDLIGKHAQVKMSMPNTVIGAFMTGVRSGVPEFTNAILDTQQFDIEIRKNLGATINQITMGALKEMSFHVPSENEKKQIGSFFANLDRLIALHQRELAKLQNIKKALLEKMFV